MVAPLFAEVVFDRPLDTAYSYSVPEHLHASIGIGKRVECSFGRGDGAIVGYVIRVSDAVPTREVKPIRKVLDEVALLDEELLKLTRWMADYYLCGWGQVLHAVVPAGVRDRAGTRNSTVVELLPREEQPTILPGVTAKQKQVLDHLREIGAPLEQNELAKAVGVSVAVVASLVTKGLLWKFHERVERLPAGFLDPIPSDAEFARTHGTPILNDDQVKVWEPIHTALETGGYKSFLLHGVTGSGKTEIYLRAIEDVVKRGKEAIVLVPEISLTPQTIERFRGRCGRVAVLHSNLTDSERATYWRHVAAGDVQVVVGARSAVFAPTRKLGLIVIDEEHETSFKQDSTPRYHARAVALMRAQLANVPILLGTATPALETWHAAHSGSTTLLTLPNRVEDRAMPKVQLVDMRHEPKTPGKPTAIGPTLQFAIREATKKGGQVILLLNRRGFSTHVHCPSCGHVAQCRHCDLSLTFHRAKAALVCHYCTGQTAPMLQCPACGEASIRYQGLGTEKLHAELEGLFPDRVIQRMDSDTMTKSG